MVPGAGLDMTSRGSSVGGWGWEEGVGVGLGVVQPLLCAAEGKSEELVARIVLLLSV